MRNADWKKQQKDVNKAIHDLNKSIYNDELWLGRFYTRQTGSSYEKYSDGSGGLLRVYVRMLDLKTTFYKEFLLEHGDPNFFRSNLGMTMNDFIIKDCKVWENEKPYEEIIDFRKEWKK